MRAVQPDRAVRYGVSAAIPHRAGVGLRFPHLTSFLRGEAEVAWVEIHAENFMGDSQAVAALEAVRDRYPVSIHAVALSLGSADGLDRMHLQRLRRLIDRIEPGLVSDHLSWSGVGGASVPDLLPLPLTESVLALVCRHVDQAQQCLGRQLLLENPSSYFSYQSSTLTEPEFLGRLAGATGCGLLLDINNVYVSCSNHGWDATAYLQALPTRYVAQLHLAGHERRHFGTHSLLVDDHGGPVADPVWALYREAVACFGRLPVLLERDNAIPPLAELLHEVAQADAILDACSGEVYANAC
ncbi:DUF692 domain-containing protein [Chitinimonas sp.]|uniref:MNIO family bufferin maturase n=1 Tax=Chitinimonas sp. TaxID=1934313 RepID=UPI002F91CE25